MKQFSALFILSFKRFLSVRNMIVLLGIFIVFLYSAYLGQKEYKAKYSDIPEFQAFERSSFNWIKNYLHYSLRGLNEYYVPSVSGIFFANPLYLTELSGKIDSIFSLCINNNCKGGLIFRGNAPFQFRFSKVMEVLLTLAIMFLGFEPIRHREFLKYLSGGYHPLRLSLFIVFSRLMILVIFLAMVIACCLGLVVGLGVSITNTDLNGMAMALGPMITMLLAFFFTGCLFGCLKSIVTGLFMLLGTWILFVFIIPSVHNSNIENASYKISSPYKLESDKLKIVNDFENRHEGGAKSYTNEELRVITDNYKQNELKDIEGAEDGQKKEISGFIDRYHEDSVWLPTTFYTSVCYEISGRGYLSYLEYYSYLQRLFHDFAYFWIYRVYFNDPKIMVSFIKADENLFKSKPMIPPTYWKGMGFSLGWVIALAVLYYFFFNRWLYYVKSPAKKEKSSIDHLKAVVKAPDAIEAPKVEKKEGKKEGKNLELESEEVNIITTEESTGSQIVFNELAGKSRRNRKTGHEIEILVDGEKRTFPGKKEGLFYFCYPYSLPAEMKVIDILRFFFRWHRITAEERDAVLNDAVINPWLSKRTRDLKSHEKFSLFCRLVGLGKSQVYFLDIKDPVLLQDSRLELMDHLERLKGKALVIVSLPPQVFQLKEIPGGRFVKKAEGWTEMIQVGRLSRKIKDQMEKEPCMTK